VYEKKEERRESKHGKEGNTGIFNKTRKGKEEERTKKKRYENVNA
jgi:hypothetical protein